MQGPEGLGPPGSRRRLLLPTVALFATVAVGGGLLYAGASTHKPPAAAEEQKPPATAPVVRGDLVTQVRAYGAMQYSQERVIKNQLPGILTWMPSPGDVVERGKRLYTVADTPVVLMYGELPAWREFKTGMSDGKDVRMLKQNLAALGYTGFTVDDKFTDATAVAIKRWQKNVGLPQTGTIELGRVVLAPEALRITNTALTVGESAEPGAEVMKVSGSRLLVAGKVPAAQQDLSVKGAKVQIELPDGSRTGGKITEVGALTGEKEGQGAPDGQGGAGGGGGKKFVPITVSLDKPEEGNKFPNAEVVVILERVDARNVLSVPVTALLPQPGGGYAVQIVEDEKVRRITVKTGAFADGQAEVSGEGVTEGMRVGVPKQ
ncbi:efflux RND transporter periplasmic adaptor subunit [Streptomyces sp. NPDC056519]|uniref:efflux RND transporter periplasmic adaptor subunit n=1 Tax=Streptomyces sp. NPDC056519 TaxID=3345849 RepID=UPI0036BAE3DC